MRYQVIWIHTGHTEEVFEVDSEEVEGIQSQEDAEDYVVEHHLELDPIAEFLLR